VTDAAPAQSLFLLGGRETLPGYVYRDFVGDRFWLVRADGTFPLRSPWVSLHIFGGIGASYLDARVVPTEWHAGDSDGLRATVGAGLALGWDVLRFDVAHGLRGGKWELIFSVVPRFRAWL
jgi:hemolysin activation/secretion protein